jgi:DNA mismatch repair protein MutS2
VGLIAQTVNGQGEVVDSASPDLAHIRAELRVAHQRLMDRLQSILASQTYRPAIQEAIITIRNGRYVIPVRADSRGVLRGLVHDHSSSGATLYIEPLQTTDLNNRWRELQLQEQEEIDRILRYISERIGAQAPMLLETVRALGDLDLALAKGRHGMLMHAIVTPISDRGVLRFEQARHPLLSGNVVPISVRLGDDFRVLLVTGPNTGGKTVALKTIGLLTLMVQSGLPIPVAPGSEAAVFDAIFADIGDEQSIEQSLSTFSGHMTNIISILQQMTPNSLLLLDELGAGTDPAEGSALARSLLTFLLERGVRVAATTHYSELKAFAASTPDVENANVEFDVETLSPTYRLTIGLPGRSNALAIAARLGLDPRIIEGSQAFISQEELRVETMLASIQHDRELAAELFAGASAAQREATALRARLEREVQAVLRERENILRAARAEAEASVEELRRELDRTEAELRLTGNAPRETVAALRTRLEQTMRQQQPLLATPAPQPAPARQAATAVEDRPIGLRDRVALLRTGQEGTVTALPQGRNEAEVQIGPFKTRAKLSELRLVGRAADEPEETGIAGVRVQRFEGPAPSLEFDLRGWRADEVAPELERYLNDAYMANMPFVRIIHGKGTGALRHVVREELATNPLVSTFRPAEAREGGEGVTVAQLAV